MKKSLLKIIERYLQFLARWKVRWAKPKIVAISGSYGKTSTKEAIYFLLAKKFGSDVDKNWGNMNSVLGLPLAILGLRKYSFGVGLFWDIVRAKWNFLFYHLPKILVLELGIDKPGEMDQLLSVAKPDIAILTGISETHLEELKDIAGVRKEKLKIIEALSKKGAIIFNNDDKNLSGIDAPRGIKIVTFGSDGADVSYTAPKVTVSGTKFILKIGSKNQEINSKLIGVHSVNILLAAAAVASEFEIGIEEIKEGLEEIKPQNGRMNPIKMKNEIIVIDDSYNSNPTSAIEALNTIRAIEFPGRKVAILGNMNELGDYAEKGHREVGKIAGKSIDYAVFVGPNAKFMATEAEKSGLPLLQMKILKTPDEVIRIIDEIIKPGDLILIKASQNGMRFENVVKYLLDDPKIASEILVRQEKKWQNN